MASPTFQQWEIILELDLSDTKRETHVFLDKGIYSRATARLPLFNTTEWMLKPAEVKRITMKNETSEKRKSARALQVESVLIQKISHMTDHQPMGEL